MNFAQVLQTFIVESRELLEGMESALLTVDGAEADAETINAIFRAAHTIKGSAGMFGLDHVVAFTHVVESVLDAARDGRLALAPSLVNLLLGCGDHIGAMIDVIAAGQSEEDADTTARGAPLLDSLREYLPSALPAAASSAQQTPIAAQPADDAAAAASGAWHISLRFGVDIYRSGTDPIAVLRYLNSFGTIFGLVTLHEVMPPAEAMDAESCYLGLELAFDGRVERAAIDSAFEFFSDESRITILPPHAALTDYAQLIRELPEDDALIADALVRCGSLTADECATVLSAPTQALSVRAVEPGLVALGAAQTLLIEPASDKPQSEARIAETRSIRVDADKLDHLINRVGELIIAAARANLMARRSLQIELQESTATLSGLVEEVRDSALQLRMVKIGATFNRFKRVVHDVARDIGKDISLQLSGEDAELDKTVVERIADPLTHLVRNAIDHGIEAADIRMARGKPAAGTIRLNAYHDSGSIVIEVSDDGGGLKRDRILAKAIERGLIEDGRALSDAEINNLVFEPGFSTAEAVTNLSGRGVGMDVVKRNIVALRGSVAIHSEEGVGTTVVVRLPLTLAIINGFLVGLGKATFVVPLDMIEECISYSAERGGDYTNLRGKVLPFIRLRELFGPTDEDAADAATARKNIVVVQYAGHRAGIVVDTLLGEFQTVIKPLGRIFNGIKCISGSSILGNGEVALILDVPALLQQAQHPTALAA